MARVTDRLAGLFELTGWWRRLSIDKNLSEFVE